MKKAFCVAFIILKVDTTHLPHNKLIKIFLATKLKGINNHRKNSVKNELVDKVLLTLSVKQIVFTFIH